MLHCRWPSNDAIRLHGRGQLTEEEQRFLGDLARSIEGCPQDKTGRVLRVVEQAIVDNRSPAYVDDAVASCFDGCGPLLSVADLPRIGTYLEAA